MKTPENIASLFVEQSQQQPQKLALIKGNASITFGELHNEIMSYAGYLQNKGIQRGDRVLIFVLVSIQLYKVVLAVMSIGATAVFLDQWSDLKRLKKAAALADCKGLITNKKLRWLSYLISSFRQIPLKLSPNKSATPLKELVALDPLEEAALITFTTGSSGTPKAAWRTHNFLFEQQKALQIELAPAPNDVCMTTLPIFTFSNLAFGITSILPSFNPKKPQQLNANNVLAELEKASVFICSPDFLMRLLPAAQLKNWNNLQKVFIGGAPTFPAMAEAIQNVFPQTTVAYGSTEAEPISSISVKHIAEQDSTDFKGIPAGALHPSVQLKIIGITDKPISPETKNWTALEVPQGEVGEIVVSGPHVLKKYFKNKAAQVKNKFWIEDTLWHRTGDSGFIDTKGMLYLTGSSKYAFWHNGLFYTPFRVENQLQQINGITEAMLLKKSGMVCLFLVKKSGFSTKAIVAEVRKKNLSFDTVINLKKLPKDPRHNSKIDYEKLV